MKAYRTPLLLTGLILSGFSAYLFFIKQDKISALILLGTALLLIVILSICFSVIEQKRSQFMDEVLTDNRSVTSSVIENISVPALIVDMKGNVIWRNNAMNDIFSGKLLTDAVPGFDATRPSVKQISLGGNSYQVMPMPLLRAPGKKRLLLLYWLDRTEAIHYQRLYTDERPCLMLIALDNFEDMAGDKAFHGTAVLAETEKLVAEMCRQAGAAYVRYENGRFLCVFEHKAIEELEKDRFVLMEQARKIDTGTGVPVSLSIAVGIAQHVSESEENARLAMELALGRGGDQVVVREGSDYRYYGGKKQQDPRQSRVKMRLFSKALHQLFETAGDVYIMGHKNPDMDCIGAAMGIAVCAEFAGSKAHIVLEGSNSAIEEALSEMDRLDLSRKLLITHDAALSQFRFNSVLVIVDTQRPVTVECPELLEKADKVVLIDHHRRSADFIDDATLHYLESRSSSASEMVTEVLQYFAEGIKPNAFVCSMLLSGISLDTRQFAFNVSSRTFEAAGYLRKNGAELNSVSSIFRSDFTRYVEIARVVESAEIDERGIAIAHCGENGTYNKLTAAQAADELLKIRGVTASFVLGDGGDEIGISGRSLGEVNVQLILERLGGGGHLTMAGAQLANTSMEEAISVLKESIEQQFIPSQQ